MSRSVLCFVGFVLLAGVIAGPLSPPKNFKICKRTDPNLADCVGQAAIVALNDLLDGDPSLKVFPLDPMKIPQIHIDQGSGPVSIDLKFDDQTLIGFKTATLKKATVNLDPNNILMEGHCHADFLHLKGKYTINGKVLVLPIQGTGANDLRMDGVNGVVTLKGKVVKRDGEEYIHIDEFLFKFDAQKLTLQLDNLFNGDKELGRTMNLFINENSQDILKELKPAIQETFGAIFKQVSNSIFDKVPMNKLIEP